MNLELIAHHYDLLYGDFEADVPLYQTFAEAADGPLLEIGCGTGRLLPPLAQAGHPLTGLDLSETALTIAHDKIKAAGLTEQITLRQADMRHFDLADKQFALTLIPLNTLMHCHTTADQLATLQTIHRHLRPGGQLIIDLFYPDPTLLAEVDGRLYLEAEAVDERSGRLVQWFWQHDIDLAEQMRHLTYILDEIDESGQVRRVRIPFSLRFIYRYEMEHLLKLSGFEVVTIYGDYDFSPFESHSPRMIFVAEK